MKISKKYFNEKRYIVFLTSYFKPDLGGIANVVEDTAVELSNRNYFDVEIISRGNFKSKKTEEYKGIKIIRLRFFDLPAIRDIIFFFRSFFLLLDKKYKNSIIHCHEAHTAGFVGYLLKLVNKKRKVIIQTHGWDLNRFLEKYWWSSWLIKKILRSVDLLLPISTFQKRQILNAIKFKNIHILPNCKSLAKVSLSKEQCKRKFNLSQTKLNILFVGRNLKRKGPHIFLNVVNSLSGVVGHVLGFKSKDFKNVKFYNEISRKEVFEFMKGCDIFLFPTKKEAFGLVFLEAASSNLAIVTSNGPNAGGAIDIFKNNVNALLVDRSVKSMRDAVKTLIDNPSIMKKLSKNVSLVCRDYTPKKIVDKYIRILNKSFN